MESTTPTLLLLSLISIFILLIKFTTQKQKTTTDHKVPPTVSYSLPIFGHGIYICFYPRQFLKYCYSKYGDVFQIKIFSRLVTVVCNRDLVSEICGSSETQLSFYNHLERTFVGMANGLKISTRASIIRKATVKIGSGQMGYSILPDIYEFIDRIKFQSVNITEKIDLKLEISRFVIKATSSALLGIEFTDTMVEEFKIYASLQNMSAMATRALPIQLTRLLFSRKLNTRRNHIWTALEKQIALYREDESLRNSPVLRAAVEAVNDRTKLPLTDHEIIGILLGLLFASTGNTSLCILHTILELEKNPECLKRVLQLVNHSFDSGDATDILNSDYMHYCILEAARLNTNIILVERMPEQKQYIGNYYVGHCDLVAIAGTLNHVDGSAKQSFLHPHDFNPDRYLENKQLQFQVMSWGAGGHACSGRLFAIIMTKLLVANFFKNFSLNLRGTNVSKPNFRYPTAFVDLKVLAKLDERKLE